MDTPINQVAESFTQWRSSREKRGRTPAHLVTQAISLVGRYRKSQITEQLGINNTMLDRWLKERESTNNMFIELSPEPTIASPSYPLTVAAELSRGTTLTFTGEMDHIVGLISLLRQGEIL